MQYPADMWFNGTQLTSDQGPDLERAVVWLYGIYQQVNTDLKRHTGGLEPNVETDDDEDTRDRERE